MPIALTRETWISSDWSDFEPGLGLLAFGEVTDEAGKERMAVARRLADRQFHRKGRAVPALGEYHASDADDALFPRFEEAPDIGIVALAIG